MCISTAYENSLEGSVLAEYIEKVQQHNGTVTLTDIMGRETVIKGTLTSADLSHGTLVINVNEEA